MLSSDLMDQINEKISDVKLKRYFLSVTVDPADVLETDSTLLKMFIKKGMKGIVICIENPYNIMVEQLKKEGLDTENIYFIDAITHFSGEIPVSAPNVIFLDNPHNLEELVDLLSLAVETERAKRNIPFVLIDGMSSLQIYSSITSINNFFRSMISNLEKFDRCCVVLLLDKRMNPLIRDIIGIFCDENIILVEKEIKRKEEREREKKEKWEARLRKSMAELEERYKLGKISEETYKVLKEMNQEMLKKIRKRMGNE
jgi:hypothetical protein